jgi:rubrerythrin
MSRKLLFSTALICLISFANLSVTHAASKTVNDLKAAYLGETTAHSKYAVYAKIADNEGYKDVARLFRAASVAESIHARNHKRALEQLGVRNPKAGEFAASKAKSTRQNLQDAIKGETYEKDIMYPGMLKDARQENKQGAIQSFNFALQVERQHAALYIEALKSLSKNTHPVNYYVCPVCGSTFRNRAPRSCPVCGTSRERFISVS